MTKNREIADVINDIKHLLKDAERNAKNAAIGYDEGWYNGECNAYEIALEKLDSVIKM